MQQNHLVERFYRYIACDSESGNERNFCLLMEAELQALGFHTWRDEIGAKIGSNGWNIGARLDGEGDPILFCCHLDTVSPGVGIHPRVEDGVIYSDGTTILASDDKSGIAEVLEAVDLVLRGGRAHRPVEILLTLSEELGLRGSKNVDFSPFTARQAIVLDSSIFGRIINKAPAHIAMHVEIHGKSAHAGVCPENGVHALKAAARAIDRIPCGQVDADTRMNVGNCIAKGKTNVVPDEAAFDLEIRCFDADLLEQHIQQVKDTIQQACDAYRASYECSMERHCGVLSVPHDSQLIQTMVEEFRQGGKELTIGITFGGSDASSLAQYGIQVVNTGTGMSNVHGTGEHIAICDMEYMCTFLQRMICL